MNSSFSKGWLVPALLVAFASPGLAADRPVLGAATGVETILIDPQPQPWGGASDTALVVGVHDIIPPSNAVTWGTGVSTTNGVGLFQTSATTIDWWYQFHLPTGALLQRVDLEACDTSTTAALSFGITRGNAPGGAAGNISAVGTTGVATTPGCAYFPVAPTATTAIDNLGNDYWLFLDWVGAGFDPTITAHSFRVYYRLQVSPAPAVATFPNDVPTSNPFFRFVEAMAASGLTGGCGPGSFCPDNPVTRGQLAVFLSVALGLHFPN